MKFSFIRAKKLRRSVYWEEFVIESHAGKRTGGDLAPCGPRDFPRQLIEPKLAHLGLYHPA
jgi:hypothetical protein